MKIKRQRKKFRESRKSLTLLFSGFSFVILLAILLVVGGIILVLIETGVWARMREHLFGWAFVLLVAFSLIIGAGLTYLLSRIMMKPMNHVINAMNELASGNFKARLHYTGLFGSNPTVKEFADSFNQMANELDHTEILRSDFINNFSHEFKTPIVSISGFAKLLQSGNLSEEQREEYTGIIAEESKRLSDMANAVLYLSRIENQTILSDVAAFNLSEQIRSCILLLEEKWTKKELEIDPDFDEYICRGSEELLKLVWINLLDNAVKFASPRGRISVRIGEQNGSLKVDISDTGAPIPEEERERIFVKFYQSDRSRAQSGNGIGLAVVRRIVAMHGGSVCCSSENGETTFTVILPENN